MPSRLAASASPRYLTVSPLPKGVWSLRRRMRRAAFFLLLSDAKPNEKENHVPSQNTQEQAKRRGRRLIRPREAWQRLGCGHTKFYQLVGAGRIRLVQLSPRIKAVVEDELDDLIDELIEARNEVASP
jgi:predicted DNA-binding transcriptional regulator AlpA